MPSRKPLTLLSLASPI